MCNWDINTKKKKIRCDAFFGEHTQHCNRNDIVYDFCKQQRYLSCNSEIWNAVFVCIIAYVANPTVWWEVFLLLHENETLLSYLMLWYKMFSKADDTSQTVYHDWYLRVEYMYMLLANTSVVSSILFFISPLSDIVNIYCIDNELGFNSSKVL